MFIERASASKRLFTVFLGMLNHLIFIIRAVLTTVTLLCIFIGALVYDFEIQVIGHKW